MAKPVISPFPFAQVKKYSLQEAEMISKISRNMPSQGEPFALVEEIKKALHKFCGPDIKLEYVGLKEASYGKFISSQPEGAVFPVVSLTPLPEKVIIGINSSLVFALIDKLLGGAGQEILDFSRKLTRLEEGILQFFFVKLLQKTANFLGKNALSFQLDKVAPSQDQLMAMENAEAEFYVLRFSCSLDSQDGIVELGFPASMLASLEARQISFSSSPSKPEEEERFHHLESFKTVFWAEMGRVGVTTSELSHLECGDIILFDEIYPEYDGQTLSGDMRLKVGDGSRGGFDATLLDTKKALTLKLESIFQEQ
jgi:flagellar motor switch protein FliM